ncbi:nitroreductase family protein, partial [Candidatus Fermentibacterales bacterium]|nr:nitroreductase family protein [Candidatus Fermentibacterales bacterium]
PEEDLDASLCSGCGTCAAVCPASAIDMLPRGPGMRSSPCFDARSCISCAHCAAYCPEDAFRVPLRPTHREERMEGAVGRVSIEELLANRRSQRVYSDREPSQEEIEGLLKVVGLSPTGMNACGVTVRALVGRSTVRPLFHSVRGALRRLDRFGLRKLLGALTGYRRHLDRVLSGEDLVFRDAPCVLFFHYDRASSVTGRQDCVIAASLVMVKACELGMATLWNGVAERLYPMMRSWHDRRLRGMALGAVLCVGFPGLTPRPLPPRPFGLMLVLGD